VFYVIDYDYINCRQIFIDMINKTSCNMLLVIYLKIKLVKFSCIIVYTRSRQTILIPQHENFGRETWNHFWYRGPKQRKAMDKDPEDLQFLGIVGIVGEAFQILRSSAKLLGAVTLTLVLPLSCAILGHHFVSDYVEYKSQLFIVSDYLYSQLSVLFAYCKY